MGPLLVGAAGKGRVRQRGRTGLLFYNKGPGGRGWCRVGRVGGWTRGSGRGCSAPALGVRNSGRRRRVGFGLRRPFSGGLARACCWLGGADGGVELRVRCRLFAGGGAGGLLVRGCGLVRARPSFGAAGEEEENRVRGRLVAAEVGGGVGSGHAAGPFAAGGGGENRFRGRPVVAEVGGAGALLVRSGGWRRRVGFGLLRALLLRGKRGVWGCGGTFPAGGAGAPLAQSSGRRRAEGPRRIEA